MFNASTYEVSLLTLNPQDIIDNLDDDYHGLSKKQIQSILKLDWDIMHDAIYDATKHFDLSEYYRDAIEDTVDILKEKYIDQTKK